MNKIITLALRNLSRQKRRNAVLAIAIAFGFFVVTTIDGLITGMVGNLENTVTQLTGGTVLIKGTEKIPSEDENEKDRTVDIIRDRDYIMNLVSKNKVDYKYVSRYSCATGQIIFEGKKSMAQIYGYDFDEAELVNSFQFLAGSKENLSDPSAIVISDKTAESMNLALGDNVVFTALTIYGQNNVADFKVAAIVKSNSFVSSMMTYANIETINSLVGIPEGGYSAFTIFLKNKNSQEKVARMLEEKIREDGVNVTSLETAKKTNPKNIARGLEKQLSEKEYQWEGTKYCVTTLYNQVPAIKTVMNVVHIITTVILLVILLIVMIGVSNTYRMVLYERIREIGTMRALGMTGKDTGFTFTAEAVILCLIGAFAGILLSLLAMLIIHAIPIGNEALALFLYKGHFSFKFSIGSVIIQYILLIVLTTLAVRGSAKKASSMSPAEALRTVK